MGKLNLLKGAYEGKVGQTTGTKWKDKKVVRTYTKPTDPRTDAQVAVRTIFGDEASFCALFTDQMKYLSSLDTKGMTVRNAIIKLNKDQIDTDNFDPLKLLVNKGGLPKIGTLAAAWGGTGAETKVTATFTTPDSSAITHEAKVVLIAVSPKDYTANVVTAPMYTKTGSTWTKEDYSTTGVDIPMGAVDQANDCYCYAYLFDKKGTTKTGSYSVAAKAS